MKNYDNSPLSYEDERELYYAIRSLPPKLNPKCMDCGHEYEVSSLVVYSNCPHCGRHCKHRSFGGGGELQNIILMVLHWCRETGVEIPEDIQSLVEDNWADYDEYYAEDDD